MSEALKSAPIFIVGCPRSGTTLMRTMLDNHPRLAVTPQSQFLIGLSAPRLRLEHRLDAALEAVLAHHRFRRWELDANAVRAAVAAAAPSTYAELMRVVFAQYAEAHGKPRWGDKTPLNALYLPRIGAMFPDAVFVHMIRDGRAVAASLAREPWGPHNAVAGVFLWRKWVRAGRLNGQQLAEGRYLEVRYESLIADPPGTLGDVCAFVGESFHPGMLDYHRTLAGRMPAEFVQRHPNLSLPPTPGLSDWRTSSSATQVRAMEAAGHSLLSELGYVDEAPRPPARAVAMAWAYRTWAIAHTWPRNVRRALRPGPRTE